MRWIRFFSPLSGIGQTNLPVVDMATLDIRVDWNDAAARLAERLRTHLT